MPKFQKGKPKTGGRKAGTPNKVTSDIKALVTTKIYTEEEIIAEFEFFKKHKDPAYRWRAFELGLAYGFGKPVMPISGAEDAPPVHIDISAIPRKRERA